MRSIEAVSEPRLGGMRAVRLGHVFGVPVFLTPSWLIVALIVTVTFAVMGASLARASSAGCQQRRFTLPV